MTKYIINLTPEVIDRYKKLFSPEEYAQIGEMAQRFEGILYQNKGGKETMDLNALAREAHENAVAHGWWDEERPFSEQIALMHSELSEALEEYRDGRELDDVYFTCDDEAESKEQELCKICEYGKPEGIPIELADVIIRIADTCGRYGIDLEHAIKIKMEYNKTRPYKHGKKI